MSPRVRFTADAPTVLHAIRGLVLGLTLSFVNLVGVFLTLLFVGGIGEWTRIQFVGIFGAFEIATGLAFIVCPNIWRMPVLEAETSDRTEIRLAASAVLLPHWAAGAKCLAGGIMLAVTIASEGVGPLTALVLPWVVLVAVFVVAISAAVSRWGVAFPQYDVVHFVIRRPRREEYKLPGLSISASILQIIAGTLTIPAVKGLPPSSFYSPEVAPSPAFFLGTLAITTLAVVAMLLVWRDRLDWRASREQQAATEAA